MGERKVPAAGSGASCRFVQHCRSMAVVVHFEDGAQEFFPEASAATQRGSLFVICKWNPERKGLDDLKSFDAGDGVRVVEVVRDGVVVQRIAQGHA